ncbi:hypothetical protein BDZ45DRAFT_93033 [Acephala macrosclerotiorum]|nr:hypothetical protein BDZ45DRAFT_93033 [Acephala macrosclerotiorum]
MADIRQLIEGRIINFEILLSEHLTPLLREQIRHAIALHREALQHPNGDPYLKDLDDLHEQLAGHWTKVFGDLISRAYLLKDIIMFQQFLVAKLLEDYTNEPYTVDKWALNQAKRIIEQEDHARVKDGSVVDTMYQVHVVFPLEEMMLSRDHVENKLRAAAIRQEHSGSDIQPLIDRRDWSNLAAALANDRHLVLKLFGGPSSDANIFDAKTYQRILHGIDEIKGEYFSELSDPSTYTISTYAREISAEQTIPPPDIRNHSNRFVWNLYNTIAGGLRGIKPSLKSTAYSTSSAANCDEATSLVNSRKAE